MGPAYHKGVPLLGVPENSVRPKDYLQLQGYSVCTDPEPMVALSV